ncbi:MAG: hypothetical protein P1V97_29120 [Planctomycetota bacterium]|nr:hypothetical protein [Planctomycetota bacterium]
MSETSNELSQDLKRGARAIWISERYSAGHLTKAILELGARLCDPDCLALLADEEELGDPVSLQDAIQQTGLQPWTLRMALGMTKSILDAVILEYPSHWRFRVLEEFEMAKRSSRLKPSIDGVKEARKTIIQSTNNRFPYAKADSEVPFDSLNVGLQAVSLATTAHLNPMDTVLQLVALAEESPLPLVQSIRELFLDYLLKHID